MYYHCDPLFKAIHCLVRDRKNSPKALPNLLYMYKTTSFQWRKEKGSHKTSGLLTHVAYYPT